MATTYNAKATKELRSLFSEIFGEILDDCGNWDAPVDAVEIVDCAVNGDWCSDYELESICKDNNIKFNFDACIAIALKLSSQVFKSK